MKGIVVASMIVLLFVAFSFVILQVGLIKALELLVLVIIATCLTYMYFEKE